VKVIDMSPSAVRWGHNVIYATEGNEVETVLLVTTPAPQVGDVLHYYTEPAEIVAVEHKRNPRDMYEVKVKAALAKVGKP
jgi:hypothetical protein